MYLYSLPDWVLFSAGTPFLRSLGERPMAATQTYLLDFVWGIGVWGLPNTAPISDRKCAKFKASVLCKGCPGTTHY